ncbi:MAG: hypothetical protein L0G69_12145 [Brevibacterium sp.]|nr:hypothetical protein [Brevibacterium sp.]
MNPVLNVFRTVNNLAHGWQVAATIFIGGSLFFVSWWLSVQGWLELGATALTFFVLQLIRMSGVSLAEKANKSAPELKQTATNIDTARREFRDWIAANTVLANCILAVLFTAVFLGGRVAASAVMTLIASPLLAAALGLAVTAVVISPVLVRAMLDTFKREETQPHAGKGQTVADPQSPSQ